MQDMISYFLKKVLGNAEMEISSLGCIKLFVKICNFQKQAFIVNNSDIYYSIFLDLAREEETETVFSLLFGRKEAGTLSGLEAGTLSGLEAGTLSGLEAGTLSGLFFGFAETHFLRLCIKEIEQKSPIPIKIAHPQNLLWSSTLST